MLTTNADAFDQTANDLAVAQSEHVVARAAIAVCTMPRGARSSRTYPFRESAI